MAEHKSPTETWKILVLSCLEQMLHQVVSIKQGQADTRATLDLHGVLLGQILEATRMVTPAEPPRSGLMQMLPKIRAWASDFLLLHKLLLAWRAISIPAACYTVARWLGLL